MGFLSDLRYFGPGLGPRRAAGLAAAKLAKAERKRRAAAALDRGESDGALLERLGLGEDPAARTARLHELLEPLAAGGLPRMAGGLPPAAGGLPRAAAVSAGGDPRDVDLDRVRERAAAVRSGRQILFGRELDVGWPPRWDWRWDGTAEGSAFAHDVRSTWEVQRLQGLLPLARAARLLPEPEREASSAAYVEALEDFLRRHPGPHGTAWESALEVGLRLVALTQGLPLVAGTRAFADADLVLLRVVDRHARWLRADLSLDKVVRGNHLLGELAGLVAAGHLFPAAREAWADGLDPQRELEAEILRQFHPDGVNVEQSLTYGKFVLEFLAVAGEAAAARGCPFSPEARERLGRAAAHLDAVTAPDGSIPLVGDCDSGRGADWGDEDPHRPGTLSARLRAVFGTPETPAPERGALLFPEGGHVAVRTPPGGFLFLRGGPFGWGLPGPASHGHADLLAPILYHRGEPVLIDPGVYGYRVGEALRDGLRTWPAHSAVSFEPPRGPAPAGTFRWRDLGLTAYLRLGTREDDLEIHGTVAWGPSPGSLQWHRSMIYNELDDSWLITDRFSEDVRGPVTWAFRFAPGVRVEPQPAPGECRVRLASGARLRLVAEPAGTITLETGWVSPGYGYREEAMTLRRRLEAPAESRVRILPA